METVTGVLLFLNILFLETFRKKTFDKALTKHYLLCLQSVVFLWQKLFSVYDSKYNFNEGKREKQHFDIFQFFAKYEKNQYS